MQLLMLKKIRRIQALQKFLLNLLSNQRCSQRLRSPWQKVKFGINVINLSPRILLPCCFITDYQKNWPQMENLMWIRHKKCSISALREGRLIGICFLLSFLVVNNRSHIAPWWSQWFLQQLYHMLLLKKETTTKYGELCEKSTQPILFALKPFPQRSSACNCRQTDFNALRSGSKYSRN